MKTTIHVIPVAVCALFVFSAGAGAQNIYDAAFLAQNDYFGTARSMAIGNAMTAVGGDLGSIGINPAGSAVASYGQFTITPGLSISNVYANSPSGTSNSSRSKFTMPNIGLTINYDTGRSSGLTGLTFGIISNQTAQYNSYMGANMVNDMTSKAAEFAFAAGGYSESLLGDYESYSNSDVPWDVLTAYQGGLFGSYGYDGRYVAVTEALDPYGRYHYVPGSLSQTSIVTREGSKNDLIFNFGFNVSDKFYFGVNLGMPSVKYSYSESFYEAAVSPDLFLLTFVDSQGRPVDTYFSHSTYSYNYVTDVDGIYAKFGFILRPFSGLLRFGAAFQTPSRLTVSEMWQYSASSSFTDSQFDLSATSPTGEYSYGLRSPYVLDLGAAIVLGPFGLFSVDYEYSDFGVMRFYEIHPDQMYNNPFLDLNEANRLFAGGTHNVRAGLEFRLSSRFSLRGGIDFMRRTEHSWVNSLGNTVYADTFINDFEYYRDHVVELVSRSNINSDAMAYSCGFGYSSDGSFFADLAFRFTDYPAMEYAPYYDYDNYSPDGELVNTPSPRLSTYRSTVNVALTLGWRF